jgi:hypothetical protein
MPSNSSPPTPTLGLNSRPRGPSASLRSSYSGSPRNSFHRNPRGTESLNHLIMVAGHAVTISESLEGAATEDAVWYLLPYQRDQDLPATFVSHIRTGVELAKRDPASLLIFSGGETRAEAGPRSEGSSYYRVAEHFKVSGKV